MGPVQPRPRGRERMVHPATLEVAEEADRPGPSVCVPARTRVCRGQVLSPRGVRPSRCSGPVCLFPGGGTPRPGPPTRERRKDHRDPLHGRPAPGRSGPSSATPPPSGPGAAPPPSGWPGPPPNTGTRGRACAPNTTSTRVNPPAIPSTAQTPCRSSPSISRRAAVGRPGDARAYLLLDGALRLVTEDHSAPLVHNASSSTAPAARCGPEATAPRRHRLPGPREQNPVARDMSTAPLTSEVETQI